MESASRRCRGGEIDDDARAVHGGGDPAALSRQTGVDTVGAMTSATPPRSSVEARLPGADPRVFEFLSAWRAARRGTMVPFRDDFDPLTVPHLLPHIWLYRFEPALGDFVCRLAGEEINDAWGRSIRGERLRTVLGKPDHPTVLRRWKQIVTVPLLHYGSAVERLSAQETRAAERLLVPLASADETVDFVLGLSLYRFSAADTTRMPLVPEDIIQIPCAEV